MSGFCPRAGSACTSSVSTLGVPYPKERACFVDCGSGFPYEGSAEAHEGRA